MVATPLEADALLICYNYILTNNGRACVLLKTSDSVQTYVLLKMTDVKPVVYSCANSLVLSGSGVFSGFATLYFCRGLFPLVTGVKEQLCGTV